MLNCIGLKVFTTPGRDRPGFMMEAVLAVLHIAHIVVYMSMGAARTRNRRVAIQLAKRTPIGA